MKTCTKCLAKKPLTDFHRKLSGHQPACKPCTNASQRARYASTADRQKAYASKWYADNRDEARDRQAAYYARNRAQIRAKQAEWHVANRAKQLEARAAYYQANKAAMNAASAAYRAANPELVAEIGARYRARKRAASVVPFTSAQLDARMAVFGHKCWMCGGPFEHVDHVKPLSRGGPHMLANLRPACRSCNTSKRASWPGARYANSFRRAERAVAA